MSGQVQKIVKKHNLIYFLQFTSNINYLSLRGTGFHETS